MGASGGRGVIGKVFFTLFLSVFLGMGLWFCYLMVEGFTAQFATYSWPKLDCTILASGVEEHPGAPERDESYLFRVRYRYETDGAEGTSDVYRWGYRGSADIGEALRLARKYSEGSQAPCWVNPDEPNSALLELESPWNVVWIIIPLIFVAVGGGGIYFTWRNPTSKPGPARTAISSRATKQAGPGCIAAFFSIFLMAGLGFLVPFFLIPLYDTFNASGWPEVSCLVEYSQVRTHPGDDGATYSVDVLYSYEILGESYKSSRYDFFTGSDSDYSSKSEFVDAHPAGTRATCFVNPDDPLDAVLRRDYSERMLWAFLPMVFVLVGGVGMAFSLRAAWRGKRGRGAAAPTVPAEWSARAARGPLVDGMGRAVLTPAATPLTRLLIGTAIALFWNGITGVFVWLAVSEWDSGEGAGCLAIFLIPFVLVGLLLLVNIPYQVLALFNPRPELTLDRSTLVLGSGTGVAWRFRGAAGRIRRLQITLEGTETVTYRRGTDTRTDSHTFATIPVAEVAPPQKLDTGQAYLAVPAETMHSFEAPHNKVVWKLKLQGEIRGWPDVAEEFEIKVEPA